MATTGLSQNWSSDIFSIKSSNIKQQCFNKPFQPLLNKLGYFGINAASRYVAVSKEDVVNFLNNKMKEPNRNMAGNRSEKYMFGAKHSSPTRGRKRSKMTNSNNRLRSVSVFSLFKTQLEVFYVHVTA